MSRKQSKNRIVITAALLLALLLSACGSAGPSAAPAEPAPAPAAEPAPVAAPQQKAAEPAVPASAEQTVELKEAEAPAAVPAENIPLPNPEAPEETPELPPEPFSPRLSEQEKVDDSFFADSAFLGNSLVRGLELYGGLESGDFYAVTSTSVVNVDMYKDAKLESGEDGTLLEALCENPHDRIYVLLGVNEISFEPDYFIELYSQMLDKIEEQEPEAEIYIMGLTPVTEQKSGEGDLFSMKRIAEYNEALYALAEERECRYVDLVEALADETGYLPEEQSVDGIHMTQDKYSEWADYLRTHYAPEE